VKTDTPTAGAPPAAVWLHQPAGIFIPTASLYRYRRRAARIGDKIGDKQISERRKDTVIEYLTDTVVFGNGRHPHPLSAF